LLASAWHAQDLGPRRGAEELACHEVDAIKQNVARGAALQHRATLPDRAQLDVARQDLNEGIISESVASAGETSLCAVIYGPPLRC
jgi:hypothetical protein